MKYHILDPKNPDFDTQLEALRSAFLAEYPNNVLSATPGTLNGVSAVLVKAPGEGGLESAPTDFVPVDKVLPLKSEYEGTPLKRVFGFVNNGRMYEVLITTTHVVIGCACWTVTEWRNYMAAGQIPVMYSMHEQLWGEEHLETVLKIAEAIQ